MNLAKAPGIVAFALNMANNDSTNGIALPMAFSAAESVGFKLFFSFDYAGHGVWRKNVVNSSTNTRAPAVTLSRLSALGLDIASPTLVIALNRLLTAVAVKAQQRG